MLATYPTRTTDPSTRRLTLMLMMMMMAPTWNSFNHSLSGCFFYPLFYYYDFFLLKKEQNYENPFGDVVQQLITKSPLQGANYMLIASTFLLPLSESLFSLLLFLLMLMLGNGHFFLYFILFSQSVSWMPLPVTSEGGREWGRQMSFLQPSLTTSCQWLAYGLVVDCD